jgi:hypothetical protein
MDKETTHQGQVAVQSSDMLEQKATPDPVHLPETKQDQDLSCGYVVGVKKDGSFVFQVLGEEKGVIQLLGLNQFAKKQINTLTDANLNQGVPLLMNVLQKLHSRLESLEEKNVPKNSL